MRDGIEHERKRQKCGFMLLEMLIAMAFLALASLIVFKLHQSRVNFDRQTSERLRRQLAVENVGERLSTVPKSSLVEFLSNYEPPDGIRIDVAPFRSGDTDGLHVSIRHESQTGTVKHHLWQLEANP